jgi:hypothetical protein
MLTVTEIVRSLGGAWELFLGRAEGLTRLDRSLGGFWRSFLVILLILPINAVSMLAVSRVGTTGETFDQLFWGGLPVLFLDWVAFPALLAAVAGPLGVKRTYVDYVVARNWASPLAAALLAVPLLLQGAGFLPSGVATLLSLVALAVVLRYHFMIVRFALRTTIPISIGVVVADVFLSIFIVAIGQ